MTRVVIVAIACLGWALVFLGLAGPIITWALFERVYADWTLGLMASGGALILPCAPFIAAMD